MSSNQSGTNESSRASFAEISDYWAVDAYCAGDASELRAQIALPHGLFRHVWRSWRDVEVHSNDKTPLIAIIPRMTEAEFSQLSDFHVRFRDRPLVAVVDEDTNVARMLGKLDGVEVVWASEVASRLGVVVLSLQQAKIFTGLAEIVAGADHMSPLLRKALVDAVFQRPPVRSVDELSRHSRRSPSTLDRAWNEATLRREKMRLKDLLDWLLLLRAAQHVGWKRGWNEAAVAVRVDARTLGRLAARLTGTKRSDIEVAGFADLADTCLHAIRATLSAQSSERLRPGTG